MQRAFFSRYSDSLGVLRNDVASACEKDEKEKSLVEKQLPCHSDKTST